MSGLNHSEIQFIKIPVEVSKRNRDKEAHLKIKARKSWYSVRIGAGLGALLQVFHFPHVLF